MSAVPSLIYLSILAITGSFGDFMDYAVLGIGNFTHRTSYISFLFADPLSFAIGVFPIFAIAYSIYAIRTGKSRVRKELHILFLLMSVAMSSVTYPLCDLGHAIPATLPYIVCLFCSVKERKYNINQKVICTSFTILIGLFCVYNFYSKTYELKMCELHNFEHLPIETRNEQNIKEIDVLY